MLLTNGNNNDGEYARQQADYFKMYTIYCSNHPTAVDTKIKLAKKNSNFRKFLAVRPVPPSPPTRALEELTRFNPRAQLAEGDAACRGLNLNDYLIKVRPSEFSSVMMIDDASAHRRRSNCDVGAARTTHL